MIPPRRNDTGAGEPRRETSNPAAPPSVSTNPHTALVSPIERAAVLAVYLALSLVSFAAKVLIDGMPLSGVDVVSGFFSLSLMHTMSQTRRGLLGYLLLFAIGSTFGVCYSLFVDLPPSSAPIFFATMVASWSLLAYLSRPGASEAAKHSVPSITKSAETSLVWCSYLVTGCFYLAIYAAAPSPAVLASRPQKPDPSRPKSSGSTRPEAAPSTEAAKERRGWASQRYWHATVVPLLDSPGPTAATVETWLDQLNAEIAAQVARTRRADRGDVDQELLRAMDRFHNVDVRLSAWISEHKAMIAERNQSRTPAELAAHAEEFSSELLASQPEELTPEMQQIQGLMAELDTATNELSVLQVKLTERYPSCEFPWPNEEKK